MSRISVRHFLAKAKEVLHSGIENRHHLSFVIGNESAGNKNPEDTSLFCLHVLLDLDSLCSSLCYAYVRTLTSPPRQPFRPIWIPLVNIPACDVSLRPEFLATLSHAGIKPQQLITLDDLGREPELESRLPAERTQWILVDHNSLQGELGRIYSQRVIGCIDHHRDEGKVPLDTGSEPRVITTSGSCTSLVVLQVKDDWTNLPSNAEIGNGNDHPSQYNAEAAKLAMAGILMDTINLTSKDKVTEHDENAVNFLKSMLPNFDQEAFFNEINSANQNIDGFSLRDILRKDYKEWEEAGMKLGIASCVKSMGYLIDKASSEMKDRNSAEAFLTIAKDYAKERNLDILCIMTAFNTNNEFKRELFVWAMIAESSSAARKFEELASHELDLRRFNGPSLTITEEGSEWRKVWVQAALQYSRKKVAPLLREAMGRL